MLRCALTQWKKLVADSSFLTAVVFSIVLYSSAVIYTDGINYDQYSVFLSIAKLDRKFILGNVDLSSVIVLSQCGTGYLSMFAPMAAAYAAVRLLCTENDCGVKRFEIVRLGRKKYHLGKYISGVVSGGALMAVGFLIYGIAVYLLFPKFTAFPAEIQAERIDFYRTAYGIVLHSGFLPTLAEKTLLMFCYGCAASAPAILLTSIRHDPYTSLCLPFFLNYALSQFIVKMQNSGASRSVALISPGALLSLTSGWELMAAIGIRAGLLIVCGCAYLLINCSKKDSGA